MAKNVKERKLLLELFKVKIEDLNELRVEYEHLNEDKRNLENELKLNQEKLTAILQEYQGKEGQVWNLNRNLSSQEVILNDFKKEIVVKQSELDKLKSEIDGQVAENKAKEEKACGELREFKKNLEEEIRVGQEGLKKINKELVESNEKLIDTNKELGIKSNELIKVIEETDRRMAELRQREIELLGRGRTLNDWEKKLEFHHKRLQWIYKKMDMQLK